MRDPYTGQQTMFARADATGRFSPIYDARGLRKQRLRTIISVVFLSVVLVTVVCIVGVV